jgi:hypothetical protein
VILVHPFYHLFELALLSKSLGQITVMLAAPLIGSLNQNHSIGHMDMIMFYQSVKVKAVGVLK